MSNRACPYCGFATEFVNSTRVYGPGGNYGYLLICTRYPACDAYVGCHHGTKKPLGRLANAELREAKKAAHAAFDPLWRREGMRRKEAYQWLSDQLQIPLALCHIGMFDVEDCRRVVEVCEAEQIEVNHLDPEFWK